MASRPAVVRRASVIFASVGLVAGVASVASNLWADGGPAAKEPAVSVYQYSAPNADPYFALALQANARQLPASHVADHVILVDTSASQSGAYRKRAMEIVNGFLAGLGENDRVKLFAIDVKAQPMMEEFASPRSEASRQACDALATRVPLGATHLLAGLKTGLAALPADRNGSIIYIGDGMSAAQLATPAEVGRLAGDLRSRHIAVHSFAVGPQTDIELLGTLAQQTGGVILFDNRKSDSPPHVDGATLATAVKAPVAYPDHLVVNGSNASDVLPQIAHSHPQRSGDHLSRKGRSREDSFALLRVCRQFA